MPTALQRAKLGKAAARTHSRPSRAVQSNSVVRSRVSRLRCLGESKILDVYRLQTRSRSPFGAVRASRRRSFRVRLRAICAYALCRPTIFDCLWQSDVAKPRWIPEGDCRRVEDPPGLASMSTPGRPERITEAELPSSWRGRWHIRAVPQWRYAPRRSEAWASRSKLLRSADKVRTGSVPAA